MTPTPMPTKSNSANPPPPPLPSKSYFPPQIPHQRPNLQTRFTFPRSLQPTTSHPRPHLHPSEQQRTTRRGGGTVDVQPQEVEDSDIEPFTPSGDG